MGHFNDFEGANAILMSGGPDDLRLLVATFTLLARTSSTEPLELHALSFVRVREPLRVLAFRSESDGGLRRLREMVFEWRISEEGWLEFAEKTASVVAAQAPAHNYLSSFGHDEAVVKVSCQEYDDGWWSMRGVS